MLSTVLTVHCADSLRWTSSTTRDARTSEHNSNSNIIAKQAGQIHTLLGRELSYDAHGSCLGSRVCSWDPIVQRNVHPNDSALSAQNMGRLTTYPFLGLLVSLYFPDGQRVHSCGRRLYSTRLL